MVYYITGALICSTLYFVCCVAGSNAAPEYKDDEYWEDSYIVYPRRVNRRGVFLSHFLPSTYKHLPHKKFTRNTANSTVHYIVPLRGIDHHLEIRPNLQLLSPGMVVENHRKRISERSINHVNETQCHYTGFVRGDKFSKVAISTCNGLTGYVRTKRHYFFIEPVPGHHPSTISGYPHIVNLHTLQDNFDINCETTGDIAEVIAKRGTRHQREDLNKCQAELHIETLIVVDHTLLTYHKEIDVENYVLTVFNMAHDLFHDVSLGTNINLAIVRLIRLEQEDHEMNLAINKDAAKTLDYFREWQNTINPKEDSHPNHHDVAILLTRIDICGNDNSCGLLGASKIGGMCDPHNQAAVCEDNGLRLGYVIAHEIAHTLAILHDTLEDSGCNSTIKGNLTTVMDPSVSIHTAGWSPCSNKFLQLFVDSGFGKCMYDAPTEHSFIPVDILPGVMYDGNFQCRELLGPNAALCMTGIECENLICYVEDKGCVETHTGVAPGTSCGEKMWCYRGQCVELGERPETMDGNWGPWSEWSECTRTCGSGVSIQERHCDSPRPKNGGKYCIGDHMRHRICATEPCDVSLPSFRDVQCAEFNSWVYPEDEKIHTWKNYPMPDENPCVLFCINDYGDVASLRPRVIDGTSCQRGVRDICINGLCQEIPCDLDLESDAVEDACGVCRGDSTSCDLVMGETRVPCCGHIKEEKLMVVPSKSINIKIEEMMPTDSRIQIRNCEGETVFVIGNVLGTFNVPGSVAWMGNIRAKQEAVRIPGPISDPVSIWVVVIENVTIRYSYGVPRNKPRKPQFYWDFLRWKRCSAECGPGIEESLPSCVEKIGGEVDDKYCKNITKPNVLVRPCEIAPCVTRWFVADWQECSKCPKGKRTRVVKCIQPTGQGEGEVIFVSDSRCVGPKPKHKEPCTCLVAKTTPSRKRDVFVDSAEHAIASAPEDTKKKTQEELVVDSNGNDFKAKLKIIDRPESTNGNCYAGKRDVSVDSAGHVFASAPEHTKKKTQEELVVDSNGNVLKAKLKIIDQPESRNETSTNTEESVYKEEYDNKSSKILSKQNITDLNGTNSIEFYNTTASIETTSVHPLNDSELLNSEECKNASLENQYKSIKVNLTAPHCPTKVEYDEELYCNETDYEETPETSNITTTPRYVNMTTCIILSVMDMANTTENATTKEEYTTGGTVSENNTISNDTLPTTPVSILKANKSDEICSRLSKLIGQTALDKDNYKNATLTIHTELEDGKRPAGLPRPASEGEIAKTSFDVQGKEAMQFLDSMQKNFENNKTKI